MEELIWFFMFMIGAVLAIGAVVWYIDKKEEERKRKEAAIWTSSS